MPCGATQDGRVMVERSDRMWSTAEGNGKPLQYSCYENPMNRMKRQKDRTLKDELPRSVGAQHATGNQWINNSRKNEEMKPKKKQHPVVDRFCARLGLQFTAEGKSFHLQWKSNSASMRWVYKHEESFCLWLSW